MINSKIVLADMHWGAINPKRFYEELEICLYSKIKSLNQLDDIIISGDLYDTKEYLTSDINYYVSKFLIDLLNMTAELGTKIYILEGTRTHDNHQPEMIVNILIGTLDPDNINNRITVINNVTEIDNMLFIPEEYIMSLDDYYKDFFNKKYDFIFGHGMIDKIWYGKKNDENNSNRLSAPVFPLETLFKVGSYIYFGHIHEHKVYHDKDSLYKKFQYVGPVTRWEFGNELECGYIYLEFDTDTKEVCDEFIVNELAPVLITRIYDIKESLDLNTINSHLDEIISKEMVNADRLRLVVNIRSNLSNNNEIKDFIISKISNYKFIKLILSYIDDDSITKIQDKIESVESNKSYVFDRNLEIENKIHEFIKNHRGKVISIDRIKYYLKECLK